MRTLLLLTLTATAWGALGDRAPSVPSAYVAAHPRLGSPDSAYLNSIWAARAGGAARIWSAATAWNSASPGNMINCRYLLLAYQAEKQNSGPNQTTYLNKIKALSSTSSSMGSWAGSICASLAYDWTYGDLDTTSRSNYLSALASYSSTFETAYSAFSSPFSDVTYLQGNVLGLLPALAGYSPSITAESTSTQLAHWRYAADVWFNNLIPMWREPIGAGGKCGASTTSDTDCGGGWHESWAYAVGTSAAGMIQWYMPSLLAWANASGRGAAFFTVDNPWVKNLAYWPMYQARPDYLWDPIGNVSWAQVEGDRSSAFMPGSLDAIAAIYNDPVIRQWARDRNNSGATPDGFDPSAWPYYTPDSSANAVSPRSTLAKVRNFPGLGTIFFRTGWTEDDTYCSFRWGNINYWSHQVMDAGAINCYNRGSLLHRSGNYRPGSNAQHYIYYSSSISQNTIQITDPSDVYADEALFPELFGDGVGDGYYALPNEGGQRWLGSGYGNKGSSTSQQAWLAPADIAAWKRQYELYKTGDLLAYNVDSSGRFAYAMADITRAYNNLYSRNAHTSQTCNGANPALSPCMLYDQANSTNRSFRAQKVVRHVVFIPRGTGAYLVVFDQIITTDSSFQVTETWHTINQPTITSGNFTATRADNVTDPFVGWMASLSSPYATSTNYQYNGKVYNWLALPASSTVTSTGGSGHQFDINGTNFSSCMDGQCDPAYGTGVSSTTDLVPTATLGNIEPGSWRVNQAAPTGSKSYWFLNVFLLTTNTSSPVTVAPSASLSGTNYTLSWQESGCTYTLVLPKYGAGSTVSKTSGCVGGVL